MNIPMKSVTQNERFVKSIIAFSDSSHQGAELPHLSFINRN
jgi:hypothetical protein